MSRSQFVCRDCAAIYSKWSGQCAACGAWNSLVEETVSAPPGGLKAPKSSTTNPDRAVFSSLKSDDSLPPRIILGIEELDRVFGGGIVPSSATLIGGDPGIGKSTLLLQVAARLALNGLVSVYVSGEEATAQLQDRARRLNVADSPVQLGTETDLRQVLQALKRARPDFVVIDSIQTMWSDGLDAAPGSVSQVRACGQELTRWAKRSGAALILVGHVTKDGQIAGPRVIEHMVDTVFYFEGERNHQFRILRAVKNRFGPTDEIGIFEMHPFGLNPAREPSALFLSGDDDTGGAAVFAAMEGSRPVLAEVQALIAPNTHGMPRRSIVGWDSNRLAMLLAVLEARCKVAIGGRDIYLSVAGGYRIGEPAGDLAAGAALLAALAGKAGPGRSVYFGEVSLSGMIRPVANVEKRLKEARRLGFERAFIPQAGPDITVSDMELVQLNSLSELVEMRVPEMIQ